MGLEPGDLVYIQNTKDYILTDIACVIMVNKSLQVDENDRKRAEEWDYHTKLDETQVIISRLYDRDGEKFKENGIHEWNPNVQIDRIKRSQIPEEIQNGVDSNWSDCRLLQRIRWRIKGEMWGHFESVPIDSVMRVRIAEDTGTRYILDLSLEPLFTMRNVIQYHMGSIPNPDLDEGVIGMISEVLPLENLWCVIQELKDRSFEIATLRRKVRDFEAQKAVDGEPPKKIVLDLLHFPPNVLSKMLGVHSCTINRATDMNRKNTMSKIGLGFKVIEGSRCVCLDEIERYIKDFPGDKAFGKDKTDLLASIQEERNTLKWAREYNLV